MNKVLPGLFLGNYRDSKDREQLERHRITHILAIHDAPKRLFPEKEYLCIMATDSPLQNLAQYFPVCNDFIHLARTNGGNVLVHCLAGMSRSVTIAVAYVSSITTYTLVEAQKVVRGARPVSNPNTGFQKQLQEFETSNKLFEERRRMLEKFPGTTFVESDAEHCKKLLLSYNNRLLSRCLSHRTNYQRSTSTRGVSEEMSNANKGGGSLQSLSSTSSSSASNSPRRLKTAISSPLSAQSTPKSAQGKRAQVPSNTPWERHYGWWREYSKAKIQNRPPSPAPHSLPPSPAHPRSARRSQRSDSVASIISYSSVISLPPLPPSSVGSTIAQASSTSSLRSPLRSPQNSSFQEIRPSSSQNLIVSNSISGSPQLRERYSNNQRPSRKLPRRPSITQAKERGTSSSQNYGCTSLPVTLTHNYTRKSSDSLSPRRLSATSSISAGDNEEEEDEMLAVVFDEPSTTKTTASIPISPPSPSVDTSSLARINKSQFSKTLRTSGANITRWVMKKSNFRNAHDNA